MDTVSLPIPYDGIVRIRFKGSPNSYSELSGLSASPRVKVSIDWDSMECQIRCLFYGQGSRPRNHYRYSSQQYQGRRN